MRNSKWFVSKVAILKLKQVCIKPYILVGVSLSLNWIAFEQAILTYLFEVVEFITV